VYQGLGVDLFHVQELLKLGGCWIEKILPHQLNNYFELTNQQRPRTERTDLDDE
jgi:hypothetical protein